MGTWVRNGTIAVTNGSTTVTGSLTNWNSSVRAGDEFRAGNNPGVEILSVTDNTHLELVEPWPYTTLPGGSSYAISQGPAWNDVTRLAVDVANALASATEILSGVGVPSNSLGSDGSAYFRQDAPELYFKTSGSWGSPISMTGPQGPAGANNITSSTTSRTLNTGSMAFTVDAGKAIQTGMRYRVSNSGSNYMEGVVTSYTGVTLTISMDRFVGSGTFAVWAIAPVGDKGDKGDTGASYVGTSTTSLAIGTGSKSITTQSGLAYVVGSPIRLASNANTANFMEGTVASYSGTSMTITVAAVGGSGTFADWNLSLSGRQGATGAQGNPGPANSLSIGTVTTGAPGSNADASFGGTAPSQTLSLIIPRGDPGTPGTNGTDGVDGSLITATSTTSLTPAIGSNVFTVASGLSFVSGMRVRGASSAAPTTNWFSGIVTSYSGTSLTISVDTVSSSPISASDWNIALTGEKGDPGAVASVNGLLPSLGNVSIAAGDIPDTDTPTNYTPTASTTRGHLQGIDTALGIAGVPSAPQCRLTATSGVAVTTSDVSGATSLYYTPAGGLYVPLYNGTITRMVSIEAELELALDSTSGHTGYHQSGKNFDLFVFSDSGTMRLGSGPAWSSDTARGTGAGTTELELKNGFFVNKNSISLRWGSSSGNITTVAADQALYVGSFRATADGQASDTKAKRLLFNAYNQTPRALFITEVATSWTYSAGSFRQVNANSANMVEVLDGYGANAVHLRAHSWGQNSTTTVVSVQTGIGVDSSTSISGVSGIASWTSAQRQSIMGYYDEPPGLGYHQLRWLEQGAGIADTQTWRNSTAIVAGLYGWVAT